MERNHARKLFSFVGRCIYLKTCSLRNLIGNICVCTGECQMFCFIDEFPLCIQPTVDLTWWYAISFLTVSTLCWTSPNFIGSIVIWWAIPKKEMAKKTIPRIGCTVWICGFRCHHEYTCRYVPVSNIHVWINKNKNTNGIFLSIRIHGSS